MLKKDDPPPIQSIRCGGVVRYEDLPQVTRDSIENPTPELIAANEEMRRLMELPTQAEIKARTDPAAPIDRLPR